MSKHSAIEVEKLSKIYNLYNKPSDRIKEIVNPLRKSYHQEFYALKDISFKIKKGDTVGILGHNGAGKSTLLKIITGVLTPTSGTIKTDGRISSMLELGAGFKLEMTGLENIYLNGTLMGFSKDEIDSKLDSIIDFADIGDYLYQPTKMYSSGMFARLAFAVSINVEPDILIVDEALSVGDIKFQLKCVNKFKELQKKGITILFVSHDISAVRSFCNSAIWLDGGKIKDIGDVVDVTAKYSEYMYGNRDSSSEDIEIKDEKIISRWGDKVGAIESIDMFNKKGERKRVFNLYEKIIIKVLINSKNISSNYLSCALSIKDKSGLDILVSTTKDYDNKLLPNKGNIEIEFEIDNYLANGEYIVAIALEDRELSTPRYFDYIEGALYFKSVVNKQLFGLFHQPVNQIINYNKE